MKPLFIPFAACMIMLAACNSSSNNSSDAANYLVGVWSYERQSYTGADTSWVWNDVAGQMIFTDKYYNYIHINRSTPRDTTSTNPWTTMSKEQLRDDVFTGVVSNTGTYKIEGDSIQLFRQIALYPNAMASFNHVWTVPKPNVVKQDTLIWRGEGYEQIWVRRK